MWSVPTFLGLRLQMLYTCTSWRGKRAAKSQLLHKSEASPSRWRSGKYLLLPPAKQQMKTVFLHILRALGQTKFQAQSCKPSSTTASQPKAVFWLAPQFPNLRPEANSLAGASPLAQTPPESKTYDIGKDVMLACPLTAASCQTTLACKAGVGAGLWGVRLTYRQEHSRHGNVYTDQYTNYAEITGFSKKAHKQ